MKAPETQKQNLQPRSTSGNVAEQIQKRAYERFLQRGRESGHELEDWLKAEQDVRGREENQQTE